MSELRVLFCCGAGLSSGPLAQQGRRYAKKNGISTAAETRSESQVDGHLGKIDVLLLGPHYVDQSEDFKSMYASYKTSVGIIPRDIYGQVDRKCLVKLAQDTAASGKGGTGDE